MNEYYNKHYITLDANNLVIGGFSDAFRQPSDNDILLTDKGSYQFRLFPDGEENPPLYDCMSRVPLYRWDGAQVLPRTDVELEADRTALERARESAKYTATRMYQSGDYLSIDGTLYRVTLSIPAGGRIAPGANCVVTSVVNELKTANGYF